MCHEWEEWKFFSMLYKRWGKVPHIRLAGGVYKPLHGAVIKSYGAERWSKRHRKRCQVSVGELNESEPCDDVSKEYLLAKLLASSTDRTYCKGQTAYWLQVNRDWDGRNSTQAFIWNVRSYITMCNKPYRGLERSLPAESCNSRYSDGSRGVMEWRTKS